MEQQFKLDKQLTEAIKCIPTGYSRLRIELYFWIGIISAILLRFTYIAQYFSPILSRIAWYVAVIGYALFFLHRYQVSIRRKETIKKVDLLKKIQEHKPLGDVDYCALEYVLWSLSVSKEKMNYLIILIFSFMAIAFALFLDFSH